MVTFLSEFQTKYFSFVHQGKQFLTLSHETQLRPAKKLNLKHEKFLFEKSEFRKDAA
jgi:hypothetical protein